MDGTGQTAAEPPRRPLTIATEADEARVKHTIASDAATAILFDVRESVLTQLLSDEGLVARVRDELAARVKTDLLQSLTAEVDEASDGDTGSSVPPEVALGTSPDSVDEEADDPAHEEPARARGRSGPWAVLGVFLWGTLLGAGLGFSASLTRADTAPPEPEVRTVSSVPAECTTALDEADAFRKVSRKKDGRVDDLLTAVAGLEFQRAQSLETSLDRLTKKQSTIRKDWVVAEQMCRREAVSLS